MTLAESLERSGALAREFDEIAKTICFPGTQHERLCAAQFETAHEHHKAILLLLERGMPGSAFALARPLFETTIRGLWLYRCATDANIACFIEDKRAIDIGRIVRAVEQAVENAYPSGQRVLSRMKELNWESLCSLTHGGYQQAARRITESHITPTYGDAEQCRMVKFADFCFFIAAVEILNLANKLELATEWAAKHRGHVEAR